MYRKLLYFMDNYDSFAGAANTLLCQAALMKRFGKEVCMVVSKFGIEKICKTYLNFCIQEEIPVSELPFSVANQPEGVHIISVIENYEKVKLFIEGQHADIVHSVQLNPVVELACRELKVPHVMSVYQAVPKFFNFPYPNIFSHFHICDSQYYAAFWHSYLGTKSYCVRTVAKKKGRNKNQIDRQDIRFICVGLLCERKNQMEVIRAFEIAKKRGIKGTLHLFGREDSLYADRCQQYIYDHGLKDYIILEGFSDDIWEIYKDSTVLICGSKSESYPNVISEALANGVIVITTPVAGVPEIIKQRENGYLCKGYSAENIAESILQFVEDIKTGTANKILNNANFTYEKIHSPEAVTEKLVHTYEEILSEYQKTDISTYTIKDLEAEFKDIIKRFLQSKSRLINVDLTEKNLWKIYFVIKNLRKIVSEQHKQCYIWGVGKYGKWYKEILDTFAPDIELSGFIDSYEVGTFMDYKIFSEKDILNCGKPIILVGVLNSKEIIQELENSGYCYAIDYFKFERISW